MSPKTERGFMPDSPEPVRRQFLIAGELVIVRALELVREFYRDGEFHDLVILSRFREHP